MNESHVIAAALEEFVTVLLDGAFDTEGDDAHLDVIALCYVMPLRVTADWGNWSRMAHEWLRDGRAPSDAAVDGNRFTPPGGVGYIYSAYAYAWWNSGQEAADHVAKVIADGLDDELLRVCQDDDCSEDDCRRMEVLFRLAGISGMEHGRRLQDHLERALDSLDEKDAVDEIDTILSRTPSWSV